MGFQNIIAALGGKLGVELDGADGACGLAVDGVDVVLQDAGDWLLVHTDLGEPPPQDPAALHRAMLEANFLYGGTGGATLAISPSDGRAPRRLPSRRRRRGRRRDRPVHLRRRLSDSLAPVAGAPGDEIVKPSSWKNLS